MVAKSSLIGPNRAIICRSAGAALEAFVMQRQLVSSKEITRLVNERIYELPDWAACALGSVLRLPTPEPDGCNWTVAWIKRTYTDGFRQAVREIKAKYNLKDV
jgi:hypothetical protein